MFFATSKIISVFLQPANDIAYLLFVGVILAWFSRTRRLGILLTSLAALAFAFALLPWSAALTNAPLENRFPRPRVLPQNITGIIVLGGAIEPYTTADRGLPTLNADAERMTEFVRLAKLYPGAKLVFSGGGGLLGNIDQSEAGAARLFFEQQGLDAHRLILEETSRNTYENVRNSKAIVQPKPGEIWLLVQSAVAVPRSVGIFSKAGWKIIPVPVAYKSDNDDSNYLAVNLSMIDRAAHEWIGLVVYRLTDKTDALFPSPQNP